MLTLPPSFFCLFVFRSLFPLLHAEEEELHFVLANHLVVQLMDGGSGVPSGAKADDCVTAAPAIVEVVDADAIGDDAAPFKEVDQRGSCHVLRKVADANNSLVLYVFNI